MVAPRPYKLKCPCGYSKIVALKSDVLSPADLMAVSSTCPKCGKAMQKVPLGLFGQIFRMFQK
ncbi:hypothetical protein NHP190003_12490 [Helicobacter sp. NHP19-003]|uniref:Uncharacterized protein n=1 Tax=Helicobacter gastrocanis TaxID=2849641 RepID=A0ABM7SDU5_9HELI|nr:hypothetical protein [Helicobacter sp. NHP19-003]BCZ17967.1 hypothetical protein NHP190003_12490 [Helicobacter sp. NHP19-003]